MKDRPVIDNEVPGTAIAGRRRGMRIVRCPDETLSLDRPLVITIGSFDGLHLGHRSVIDQVKRRSAAADAYSALVTFHPHPRTVVGSSRPSALLVEADRQLELLGEAGLEVAVVINFDRQLAEMEPETFVQRFLVGLIAPIAIVVGKDFRFGRGRRGDVQLLADMGAHHGFEAVPAELLEHGSERISSSRIRGLLQDGNVAEANVLLGRPYELHAMRVEPTNGGCSTLAGIARTEVCVPLPGSYRGWCRVGPGASLPATITVHGGSMASGTLHMHPPRLTAQLIAPAGGSHPVTCGLGDMVFVFEERLDSERGAATT